MSFETYTFTNCGSTGRTGPSSSQIENEYEGTNLEGLVERTTNGIQEFAVPLSGIYRITVYGAEGGSGRGGAKMSGEFELWHNQKLHILIGQESPGSLSGGGGTFVVDKKDKEPLIIAGGSGGEGGSRVTTSNLVGRTSSTGGRIRYTTRARNGEGGESRNNSRSGGGGGFKTDGGGRSGGQAFVNGGLGGSSNQTAGFGGGGARAGAWGAGAGGGYSGGTADGENPSRRAGAGGGSYNVGDNQNNSSDYNYGHGKAIFELITPYDNVESLIYEHNINLFNDLTKEQIEFIIERNYGHKNIEPNFYVSFKNSSKILKYNNVSGKYLFKNIKDIDFRAILLNDNFDFNKSNNKIKKINLNNKAANEKELNNVKIKRNENNLNLTINDIMWKDKDIKANYALIYDKNTGDLLYCIDFNGVKTSNSRNNFVVRFKNQKLFELTKDNRLDLEVLNILEGEVYNLDAKYTMIKKELENIKRNKTLKRMIFQQPKFIEICFNHQKLFNLIKEDLLNEIFDSRGFGFYYDFTKSEEYPILKFISSNEKMLSKLTLNTKFPKLFIDNSETIIKNYNNDTIKNSLKSVIDYFNEKSKVEKIYKNYKFLIDDDKYLKHLYENKAGDSSE